MGSTHQLPDPPLQRPQVSSRRRAPLLAQAPLPLPLPRSLFVRHAPPRVPATVSVAATTVGTRVITFAPAPLDGAVHARQLPPQEGSLPLLPLFSALSVLSRVLPRYPAPLARVGPSPLWRRGRVGVGPHQLGVQALRAEAGLGLGRLGARRGRRGLVAALVALGGASGVVIVYGLTFVCPLLLVHSPSKVGSAHEAFHHISRLVDSVQLTLAYAAAIAECIALILATPRVVVVAAHYLRLAQMAYNNKSVRIRPFCL